jgi:hypothetical protein
MRRLRLLREKQQKPHQEMANELAYESSFGTSAISLISQAPLGARLEWAYSYIHLMPRTAPYAGDQEGVQDTSLLAYRCC